MRRVCTIVALGLASLLSRPISAPAQPAAVPWPGEQVFCLGTPDDSAREFGLARERWPAFQTRFPKPVVFTVGKDPLAAWPYIHPGSHDKWAGGKDHTFTLRFTAAKVPAAPVYLTLGIADSWEPSLVAASLNGKPLGSRRAPAGSGNASGNPAEPGRPEAMTFPVPAGALAAGENTLAITLSDGSWILYDYVYLGTAAGAAPRVNPAERLYREALAGPLAKVDEIVLALRKPGGTPSDGHWYANIGYHAHDTNVKLYGEGAQLLRVNIRNGKSVVLLDDPKGGVRDPQVSYDGRKILFSYRKGGSEYYHLYEINADGTALKQLTDGPFDDIEPTWLPNDEIVFVSTRCNRWVNCWLSKVAVLYRCGPDGSGIHPVSSNNEQDNTPWPLPDGRILYTRWEYVDRSQVDFHHLWVVNPDGSSQMTYYGNMHPGTVMIDAKPIPNSESILSIFSPGHGSREHQGFVTVVDPRKGPDDPASARNITRNAGYRDPWAFAENCYMAATAANVMLLDDRGAEKSIFVLPEAQRRAGLWVHEPRPLMPRERERVIPDRAKPAQPTGQFFLANVADGRNMAGVKPGEIKKLLVLETLPKPINFTGGMEPLSYGGTFTLERILGTVPVEADGSAYFEVPALRSVFFVALDENDLAVKRMQSFVTLQPGETTGCVGCHEQRTRAPRTTGRPLAYHRAASKISPISDVPDVLDFTRDIQPILTRHCLPCHDFDQRAGKLVLSGDRGPLYSHSYFALFARSLVSDGRNLPRSNYAPRALGSPASRLLRYMEPAHEKVQLSPLEKKTVRLWIDTGAPYPGTYAALGSGMIGGYFENKQDPAAREWPETKAAAQAIARRCVSCHRDQQVIPQTVIDDRKPPWENMAPDDTRRRLSRHLLFNLTRPEKSPLLLAPLARAAGGWASCRAVGADGKAVNAALPIFASVEDADYKLILAAVARAGQELDAIKRFDMPGFRPRKEYIRELQHYGVLPATLDPAAQLDCYALERRYWESLWYNPPQSEP